jgi:hypothetical protein
MLITEKRPSGTTYPQLKQVPTNTYADFLNFFRDGHTVDDNLAGPATQATLQYKMLETATASGHLAKSKNRVNPDEFLLDIFLTEAGSELIQTYFDRKFCEMAVAEAKKSIAEDDGELHPCVGSVVVKGGEVLATGYRGETGEGRHAEFCALKKINNDVNNVDLSGCTIYTTFGALFIKKIAQNRLRDSPDQRQSLPSGVRDGRQRRVGVRTCFAPRSEY